MMAELHEVMHLIVRHILLPSSGSTPYILTFAPNTEIRNHGMMGAINLKKLPVCTIALVFILQESRSQDKLNCLLKCKSQIVTYDTHMRQQGNDSCICLFHNLTFR